MQNSQNTTTPIVSFIVTYHNEDVDMLKECLKSILSLSFATGEREVILIDDGSDVSPINEIEDFRDDILYLRQPNRGLSEARNAGIDLARGEYIQFVDADDYLIKLSYELCLGLLKRERPDVIVFNFTKEEGDTDIYAQQKPQSLRLGIPLPQENAHLAALHSRTAPRRRGVHAAADTACRDAVLYRQLRLLLS